MNRVICWFSRGATSAVAAYLALKKYPDAELVYIDTHSEHPDGVRFQRDVEAWLGKKVTVMASTEYNDVDDVIKKRRYLRGRQGAPCSGLLKKAVRFAYQLPDDRHVFGYHVKEKRRVKDFIENNPELDLWFPLIDAQLDHSDCLAMLSRVGIEIPEMYKLGFNNNNCLGCVKAESPVYWNLTRQHFPAVFARRAQQERELDYALCRVNKQPVFLDELDPALGLGQSVNEPSCGMLCEIALSQ